MSSFRNVLLDMSLDDTYCILVVLMSSLTPIMDNPCRALAGFPTGEMSYPRRCA